MGAGKSGVNQPEANKSEAEVSVGHGRSGEDHVPDLLAALERSFEQAKLERTHERLT